MWGKLMFSPRGLKPDLCFPNNWNYRHGVTVPGPKFLNTRKIKIQI
jgi:hypothetical protein